MLYAAAVTTLNGLTAPQLLPIAQAALNLYLATASTGNQQVPISLLGALSSAIRTALGDDVSINSGINP